MLRRRTANDDVGAHQAGRPGFRIVTQIEHQLHRLLIRLVLFRVDDQDGR
jgi:hypothetical protein